MQIALLVVLQIALLVLILVVLVRLRLRYGVWEVDANCVAGRAASRAAGRAVNCAAGRAAGSAFWFTGISRFSGSDSEVNDTKCYASSRNQASGSGGTRTQSP
jgi:hypothetical protein